MKSNLHSHTQFCDGRSSMEEIINAAIKAGFTQWGFTPHSPICLESPCNMKLEDVEWYLQEIERLRKKYPQIKILAGMEVDFIDEENGPASSYVKDFGLDYVIGSIHFIPNQKGEFHDVDGSPERFHTTLMNHFEGDINFVVRSFWNQTQRMIRAGEFDIIGHIDKISLNASSINPAIEETKEYKDLALETIDLAIRTGKAIEINTKHFKKFGRFFPNPKYWNKIIFAGVDMPVNTDAHYADKIEDGRKEALEILQRIKVENSSK